MTQVIIDGQVLDVTKFLPDHPGGAKGEPCLNRFQALAERADARARILPLSAILLYAGRDATEEFDMLHERSVITKYAKDTIIGKIKK